MQTAPLPCQPPPPPSLVLVLPRLHAAAAGAEEESADAPVPGAARACPRRLPPLTPSRSARRRRRLEPERPAAAGAGRGRWGWAEARRRRRRQRRARAPAPRGPSAASAGRPARRPRSGGGSDRNILGSWCLDIGVIFSCSEAQDLSNHRRYGQRRKEDYQPRSRR